MSCQWMRRALLALASTSLLVLAACGSGTIESQFHPSRVVAFGTSMSDLGEGGTRYTVNDVAATTNIWTQVVATSFANQLQTRASGGTSYATGNARISLLPDAAGVSTKPTVTQQIDNFLAANAFGAGDLVLIEGGVPDIIAEMAKVTAGTQTADQMIANVQQAGKDLGAQVRRLVTSGASHVVVTGTYDLSRSPWAAATGQGALLTQASTKFNEALLVSIVDLGNSVLYIDAAFLFNLMTGTPSSYNMANAVDPVCTSVDAGPGIGIGTGQVNSALCTTTTTVTTAYSTYVFADKVYFSPGAQIKFGEYAYSRISVRW